MIQEALRSLLLSDVGVSTLAGDRIYGPGPYGLLPQKATVPAVSISRPPGTPRALALDGASGIRAVRIQVDSWAATGDEAWKLALAIDNKLVGFAGVVPGHEEHINLITQATGPGEFPEPVVSIARVTADYFCLTAAIEEAA